ncbi:hypothetical protein QJQ45_000186 [Haematococcus lacustris]|nr:hypothetical protein QJQ45_000186 [Haematococcus lacustris]
MLHVSSISGKVHCTAQLLQLVAVRRTSCTSWRRMSSGGWLQLSPTSSIWKQPSQPAHSLVAKLKRITVTLATWDVVWEVYLDPYGPPKPPQAPCSSQEAKLTAASEPGPSTPLPAKRSKRTKVEQAAEPTQPTKGKGKAAKAMPAPQPGRQAAKQGDGDDDDDDGDESTYLEAPSSAPLNEIQGPECEADRQQLLEGNSAVAV